MILCCCRDSSENTRRKQSYEFDRYSFLFILAVLLLSQPVSYHGRSAIPDNRPAWSSANVQFNPRLHFEIDATHRTPGKIDISSRVDCRDVDWPRIDLGSKTRESPKQTKEDSKETKRIGSRGKT